MYVFNLPRRLTAWLALLFVGSAGSVVWAMPDVVQPSSWKPGDGWHVRMIATPRGEAASRYDMHVVVTGAEKLGDVSCWRLEFIPVAAPQALGPGYRVWFDKTNGTPRRMSWRKKSKTAEPKLILEENLPLSLSPPLGFPLEVVPFVVTPLLRAKDGRTELRLSAQREPGYTWWSAALSVAGKDQLVVRQKWIDGEKWWSEYERWREGHKELSGAIVPKNQQPITVAAKLPQPLKPSPSKFQDDKRLKALMTATFQNPTTNQILQRLQEITGVKMVADMGKGADEPLALSISFNRTPTWQVMDQLARDFLVEGRWDKIDSGYQLYALPRSRKAVPALPRMAVPAFSTHKISIAPRVWLSYLSIPVLLGIIYWLSWYHKRQTQQVQAAREPQADPTLPSSP